MEAGGRELAATLMAERLLAWLLAAGAPRYAPSPSRSQSDPG